jgi:hypothetical protein
MHSHRILIYSMLSCVAFCPTYIMYSSVSVKKIIFLYPQLLVSIQQTPVFSALHLLRPQMLQCARRSFRQRLCETTFHFLSTLFLFCFSQISYFLYCIHMAQYAAICQAFLPFPVCAIAFHFHVLCC